MCVLSKDQHSHLTGTVPADVADPSALVAGLGASIRAVLHHVTKLVAVIAGIFILGAVADNVSSAITLVIYLCPAPKKCSKLQFKFVHLS